MAALTVQEVFGAIRAKFRVTSLAWNFPFIESIAISASERRPTR